MADKNRRSKLLINPKFQVAFMRNLIFLNIGICAIFYLAHSYFFWQGRELGNSIQLPSEHVFYRFLDEQQRILNLISIGTMFVVSTMIVFFGLLYSHRIAGPVYRFQKYLKNKVEGKDVGELSFREEDYFPELAESLNKYIEHQEGKKAHKKKSA